MMQLVLRGCVHHGCCCWHINAFSGAGLHLMHHRRSGCVARIVPPQRRPRRASRTRASRRTADQGFAAPRCAGCISALGDGPPSASPGLAHADGTLMCHRAADMPGTHLERRSKDASYLALRYKLSHRCNHQPRGITSTRSVQAEVFSMAGTLLCTSLDRGGPEGDLMELNGWVSPQMLTRYGGQRPRCPRPADL
jgi:hypothetical protein